MIDGHEFCTSIGGIYDDNGDTCTVQRRSNGQQPSCLRAASKALFADELGPCYDFQRLENSVYRERYRLSDKCNSQLQDFKSFALGKKGMCSSVDAWRGAKGVFIPSQFPVVSISQTSTTRECNGHRTQSRCESSLCAWSDAPTFVKCIDKSSEECIQVCSAMGGELVNDECVVPRCRPTQMADTAC